MGVGEGRGEWSRSAAGGGEGRLGPVVRKRLRCLVSGRVREVIIPVYSALGGAQLEY